MGICVLWVDEVGEELDHVVLLVAPSSMLRAEGGGELEVGQGGGRVEAVRQVGRDRGGMGRQGDAAAGQRAARFSWRAGGRCRIGWRWSWSFRGSVKAFADSGSRVRGSVVHGQVASGSPAGLDNGRRLICVASGGGGAAGMVGGEPQAIVVVPAGNVRGGQS